MAFSRIYACQRVLVRSLLVPTRNSINSGNQLLSGRRLIALSAAKFDTNKVAPKNVQYDWNRAVSEAERIVGYPTSFLNLRWILNDEIANVALHLRKIIGSNHPLLKTAKSLLYNGKTNMQGWGLIVLLVSKAAGHAATVPDMEQDKSAGVLHSQRGLAEITEMIRISFLIHQSMVNLQPLVAAGNDLSEYSDDTFGNKIGLLTGDYLLSVSCNELSSLRNQFVIESISSAVRDLAEGDFVGDRDEQNNPLPARPILGNPEEAQIVDDFDFVSVFQKLDVSGALGHAEREWTVRHLLSTGSLLGKACMSTLILADQPKELQHKAYLFGKHLALAWQACIDLEPFQVNEIPPEAVFSLVSAPVLYHLHAFPETYAEIEKGREHIEKIDFVKLHAAVLKGPGLEKTRELQRKHILSALKVLDELPNTDARTALQNIILAMQEL